MDDLWAEADYIAICNNIVRDKSLSSTQTIERLQCVLRHLDSLKKTNPKYGEIFQRACNMLMYVYINQCHDLSSAKLVFEGMVNAKGVQLTEVSLTTLITGIVRLGTRADLYSFLNSLRKRNLLLETEFVYIRIMSALRHFKDVRGCSFYFAEMLEKGLESIQAYRFMMTLYRKDQQPEMIIKLYKQMRKKGLLTKPDASIYGLVIDALNQRPNKTKDQQQKLFDELRNYWIATMSESTAPTGENETNPRMIIYLLMDWDPLTALQDMKQFTQPVTQDFNEGLSAYVKQNQFDKALHLLKNMNKEKVKMDAYSYSILLDALAKDVNTPTDSVFQLYDEMIENGIKPDTIVFTSLLTACNRARDFPKALSVLEEMEKVDVKPNIYTYNSVFNVMASHAHITWNSAKKVWEEMLAIGIKPDTRTFNIYLSILANLMKQSPSQSQHQQKLILDVYRQMKYNTKSEPDYLSYTIVMNALANAGLLRAAMQVYNDTKLERVALPVSAYNTLMSALQKGGQVSEAMYVWHDMKIRGVLPDNVSYEIALEGCEQLGLTETIQKIREQRSKAKNARTKRFLKNREAKVNENPKTSLFVRGSTTSQVVNDALKDLYALKRPNAIHFTKKNELKPFEDEEKLEFFSQKNDSAHLIVGSHSKKRPHNVTFIRMFNHQLLDMYEFGLENAKSLSSIPGAKCSLGLKPLMVFNGERFDSEEKYKYIKNFFLDFFNGEETSAINLAGLEHVISLTAVPDSERILLRTYSIQMKKSGLKTPHVWNAACKKAKTAKAKKVKNIEVDEMGDKYGRIHLGKQDFNKIQTRKMKGLKKRGADEEEEEEVAKRQKVDDEE
ncbi:Brix domain-containing protein [Cokeromyces recurvatus]|uniref:Brix domain-containing protein n=1 Tax=Cokeromyces recurvatus TaxID=90255 RepID=UPI00221F8008|nr:Brix domain-containing protein [Cokeromyces recurvatus]KAI7903862.1 Brix domain-containing protein [Cokeromyces recurvatus]